MSAALEPPAAIPHKARREALVQRATTRTPGTRTDTKGSERDSELSSGESVSKIIAESLSMSARSRYVFASG